MMGYFKRAAYYKRQNNSESMTPKQRKRAQKKINYCFAKRNGSKVVPIPLRVK